MKAIKIRKYGSMETQVHHDFLFNHQAEIALELMGNMAMVAALPDGETSSGRQKLRMMTPEEVVERATSIAAIAYAKFASSGWLFPSPVQDGQMTPERAEMVREITEMEAEEDDFKLHEKLTRLRASRQKEVTC